MSISIKAVILIDTVEFLGISAYHPIELEMNRHFKFSVDKFKFELKKYKLEIPQGLTLHFSEVGIGTALLLAVGQYL